MQKMNQHEFNVVRESAKSGKVIMNRNMKPKALVSYLSRMIWDESRISERICYDLFTSGKCSFGADNDDTITVTWA